MAGYIGKKRAPNRCSTPRCKRKPEPGRRFCKGCAERLAGIKTDLETDPKLLYHQRSDNRGRSIRETPEKKKAPRLPICCAQGCYELRVPPDPFCGGAVCMTQ